MFFEVDTYWVKVAAYGRYPTVGLPSQNVAPEERPARWSEKLAEDNPDPMTGCGEGHAGRAGDRRGGSWQRRLMIVEMDKTATDVFGALQESYDYVVGKGLASGKK
ncbi:MAG: hypothetical protein U0163_02890 [Gemmatimonadaceae bacterium]